MVLAAPHYRNGALMIPVVIGIIVVIAIVCAIVGVYNNLASITLGKTSTRSSSAAAT